MRRLATLAILLTALTAGAASQEMLMRTVWGKRGVAPSVIGGAVEFNFSEYFTDAAGYPCNGATSLTFSAWIKSGVAGSGNGVFMALNPALGVYQQGTYTAWLLYVNGRNMASSSTIGVPELDVWKHVVCVWDNGVGKGRIYVNCATALGSTVETNACVQTNRLTIGTGYIASYRGTVDDCAVFVNRVLTSNEVAELYNNGKGNPVTSLSTGTNGLVRYWKLDDGLSNPNASNALDSVSGTYATGTAIGVTNGNNDWVQGIVPQ